ncbi:MAG TPA: GFA family protein [Sphingobium sp.]
MSITGKCLCGSVSLAIDAEPITARLCWCRVCQSLAAGNAAVNVVFPTEAVATTGEVRWYESVADSGNAMRRGFCPTCGTSVFSIAEVRPHLTIVRAGVLNDADSVSPQAIIWTDSAPKWSKLDPDLPQVQRQPS